MGEYAHCEQSSNIKVNVELNFIDSFSFFMFKKQLRIIKLPTEVMLRFIKGMEELRGDGLCNDKK
jgi:hypothetical protein